MLDSDTQTPLRLEGSHPSLRFGFRFSINCIYYNYRHWKEIGGGPAPDEIDWGNWIQTHDKFIILAADTLLHHYSFFLQQDWLDRIHLIEDISRANLPDSPGPGNIVHYHVPQRSRLIRQILCIVGRRLQRKKS